MSDLRTAAQQALEALELGYDSAKAEADQFHFAMAGYKPHRHAAMDADVQKIAQAITALKAALEQPEQEPVAWTPSHIMDRQFYPPRREWRGLTDEDEIPWDGVDAKSFAKAIESALKEKNK